jgi:hypothetical protein
MATTSFSFLLPDMNILHWTLLCGAASVFGFGAIHVAMAEVIKSHNESLKCEVDQVKAYRPHYLGDIAYCRTPYLPD